MLLTQRIETTSFSPSESEVIHYILSHVEDLKSLTIKDITDATYTSAPIVIRAAKKLGLNGFNDLKETLINEMNYLYAESDVDASIPFVINDHYLEIANNIAKLEAKSIEDTLSLLNHDEIYESIALIRDASYIDVYANSSKTYLGEEFAYKMSFIQKKVYVARLPGDPILHAAMSDDQHVAIIISYSGETRQLLNFCESLKKNHTHIILISSLGENSLSQFADVCLHVSSKEMIHTKIGDFASSSSIKAILDILYACVFSLDYEKNLERRIALAKMVQPFDPEK